MEILTRSKLCHFVGHYVVRAKLFCLNSFFPVTGLECSYGKIFFPVTEISVAKTEISVTWPAQPLIWTHWYFYKERSGEVRSQKPSQPGLPGSYEEALKVVISNILPVSTHNELKFSLKIAFMFLAIIFKWQFPKGDIFFVDVIKKKGDCARRPLVIRESCPWSAGHEKYS